MKRHKHPEELQDFTLPEEARLPQAGQEPHTTAADTSPSAAQANGVTGWKTAAIVISILAIAAGVLFATPLPFYTYTVSAISLVAFACAGWGLKKRNAQGFTEPSFTWAFVWATVALFWPFIDVLLSFLSGFFVYGILMNLPGATTTP